MFLQILNKRKMGDEQSRRAVKQRNREGRSVEAGKRPMFWDCRMWLQCQVGGECSGLELQGMPN